MNFILKTTEGRHTPATSLAELSKLLAIKAYITLDWNSKLLTEESAVAAAALVAKSTSITSVNFGGDSMGEHAIRVAAELAKSTSITSVNFAGNSMGEHAIGVVAELAKSTSIQSVNFSSNYLDICYFEEIKHLTKCKTLHTVIFEDTYLEAIFIDAVIATGDLERITKVLEHNPSVSSYHIYQVLALLESQGDQTTTITGAGACAGAGSSDDAEPDVILKQPYTLKLHLALLNLCKKFHVDPDTPYLKAVEQNFLYSIFSPSHVKTSLTFEALDIEAVTHLVPRNLDLLVKISDYTNPISLIVRAKYSTDQIYQAAGNIISSLSTLDKIAAKLYYGKDIIPLIRNSSEAEVDGLGNKVATEDFYTDYGIKKLPGSVFMRIYSNPEDKAEFESLLAQQPALAIEFARAVTFLGNFKQYLPATLSEIGDITLEEEAASGEAGAAAGGASAAASAAEDIYADLPPLEYVEDEAELTGDHPGQSDAL